MRRLSEPQALSRTIKQLGITNHDAVRMAHLLVSETVRRLNFIDEFINNVIRPDSLDKYNLGIQAFLRLYVYQTRIAKGWTKTNADEAENIARICRAVLDWEILQQVEPFLGALLTRMPTVVFEGQSDEGQIGLRSFHPLWFVKYCLKLFGREEAIRMLQADMKPPPTYIRVNTLEAKETDILETLAEENICIEGVKELRHLYEVTAAPVSVTSTRSYKEGLFCVQDKASCFAVEAGKPKQGMSVYDVCAAPGIKTAYLAQLMQNEGAIVSLDFSRRRMDMWKKQIAGGGVRIAESAIADARSPLPLAKTADLLLLDPPCTGTGTFGKSPHGKWRLTQSSGRRMAEIQWQMLHNCSDYVNLGGELVYCTCSVMVEENEMVIERFLKWHPEFVLTEIVPSVGLPGLRGLEKCQRLFPHVHRCNGFFVAKMMKIDSGASETQACKLS